ncbi:O-antigen ligase family protein [Clostridium gasigenes]|uniref:O-antigen ligase family protein n=1 Tax=Clostridium gasigenes TaxID=94869 RepID=UPI0014382E02|nr:O-antigen ligase family protein [Clostridium gasigenes]NKF08508.1 O-antigen ligase family protein [Clostridium gasigenes]QSW21321.1 O-antigen ligase family protein [Clostridium gasigenes]
MKLKQNMALDKVKLILIILFPIATFIGPFYGIGNINVSNIYSLVLLVYFVKDILGKRFKYIGIYILSIYIFIFYAFGSLIWGKYNYIGFNIILPLITCCITMIFIASFNNEELDLFFRIFRWFTIIIVFWSLIEIVNGKYLFFNNIDFIYVKNQYNFNYPATVFINPNDLAQFLVVSLPFTIYYEFKYNKNKLFKILITVTSLFVVINTASRLAMICILIICIVYYIIGLSTEIRINIRKIMNILVLFFSIVLIFITISNVIPNLNIFEQFLNVDSSGGYYTSRDIIYRNIFQLGLENLIFGAGLGGSYVISEIGPHNMLLFIFSDFGICITIGFIIILINLIIFLIKYKKIDICNLRYNRITVSTIIVFPILASISSANEQRKIVWILLGIGLVLIKLSKKYVASIKNK